jgi:hypothetical protein
MNKDNSKRVTVVNNDKLTFTIINKTGKHLYIIPTYTTSGELISITIEAEK